MPEISDSTLLLPVVTVGDLGIEHLEKIFFVKLGQRGYSLCPLLSLKTSLREMYAGDSEYANRLFYLASLLPADIIAQHVDSIVELKDVFELVQPQAVGFINS